MLRCAVCAVSIDVEFASTPVSPLVPRRHLVTWATPRLVISAFAKMEFVIPRRRRADNAPDQMCEGFWTLLHMTCPDFSDLLRKMLRTRYSDHDAGRAKSDLSAFRDSVRPAFRSRRSARLISGGSARRQIV